MTTDMTRTMAEVVLGIPFLALVLVLVLVFSAGLVNSLRVKFKHRTRIFDQNQDQC